ncbi:MAG: inositol monophosphatase [Candidatus Marinimicrobia bacterium]|nr:inositol monophosphatase [Candidatus Neomarinimicrobiota bacterium]
MTPAGNIDQAADVALKAARQAGAILMDHFQRLERVEKKGLVDLVTEADLASEASIVAALREAYPKHAIIAEEGDYAQSAATPHRWVIDPLDGTTNYVHGLPIFAVSIGYQVEAETVFGVVLNPAQGEEYVAVRGQGATLNGEPIQVSGTDRLRECLLATGFPYTHDDVFQRSFDLFRELYNRSQGIRRLGAAALDFCYVAAGRFDAYYEANLHSWDLCAGDLICREAGGQTSDWRGGPLPFSGRRVLASNGTALHGELLAVLAGKEFAGLR